MTFNKNPSAKELKVFAIGLPLFLLGLGCYLYVGKDAHAGAALSWILAGICTMIALWRSAWIKPIYLIWMAICFPIGYSIHLLLFAAIYYAVLTPIALYLRLRGKTPLQIHVQRHLPTYWQPKTVRELDIRRYFRQF